ncbi:MAG: SGNH/GDSL hydrolase family protein [Gemmatimonadota bacterium]
MALADPRSYLADVLQVMRAHWPANRTVNVVCHGHSVPAGYFATPAVDTFSAYPHLLHRELKRRFPFAVVNVIVTAIGGENSESGAGRFDRDVLGHRPDVITIDYGLNDRAMGLPRAAAAWRAMIDAALARQARVLLLTPTHDTTQVAAAPAAERDLLPRHADLIRRLAEEHGLGLADSFQAFAEYSAAADLTDLLSWSNHPNRRGHELVARQLLRWFPAA